MNKFGMVLGIAAVATLAGCKDPDYKYDDGTTGAQNEVKSAESQPQAETQAQSQSIAVESISEPKCTCLPGTKHTSPCACGASDCKCVVEPVVIKTEAPKSTSGAVGSSSSEYTTYIVQKGDVLSKIAKKYNLKVSDIRNANPNVKKDVIWVGMKLKLPGQIDVGAQQTALAAAAATAKSAKAKKAYVPYTGATKTYVVKSGDTLGAIAYGNGINIRQLKELNGLKTDMVKVGQKLKIPAEKVVAAKPVVKAEKKTVVPVKVEAAKPVAPVVPAVASAAPVAPAAPAAAPAAPAAEPTAVAEPVAAAAAPAAAPAAASAATYVVQEGDDMTGVSIRWGVSAAAIRELNNLPDDAQLVPGQILKLPADAQQ